MKTIEELKNQIICGDCLEVMKDIPDKSIDLVLTDPPYGVDYVGGQNERERERG
jgi:site-specific DNA-methyltransferase (adenine-specific)